MKYGYIDSIRGIAILMVILVHTSQSLELEAGALNLLSAYGQMGVQLFFVVSAFTLCLSYSRRANESSPVLAFYIRRSFRIAPMYYLGIAGYCLFRILIDYVQTRQLGIPEEYSLTNILANVFFIHGLYAPANNNVVPGGWSIGTEMLFYLIFPALMLTLYKHLKRSLALAILFPVVVAISVVFIESIWLSQSNSSMENNSFMYFSILNQFPVFAIGITLFFLLGTFEKHVDKINTITLLLLFLTLSISSIYFGWLLHNKQSFLLVPILSALSFVFLILLFKRIDWLNVKLLRNIGQRSYSMYLVHFVFAHQVSRILNEQFFNKFLTAEGALLITYLMSIFASYVIAGLTYKFIEIRFMEFGSSLIKKLSKQSPPLQPLATAPAKN